jgi:uncharacterized protein with HEPN domain
MTTKMGFERATEQEQIKLGELLWDIHAAAMKIVEFTTGRDFADFAASELLRSVVASMLGIIAEALRRLQAQFPGEFVKISNANHLLEPAIADQEKLWRLVEEQIPDLIAESRAVLEDWHQA